MEFFVNNSKTIPEMVSKQGTTRMMEKAMAVLSKEEEGTKLRKKISHQHLSFQKIIKNTTLASLVLKKSNRKCHISIFR